MSISPALDCFTIIKVALQASNYGKVELHGIGTPDTGAHYIRSEPFYELGYWDVDWENMGYTWSPVATPPGSVTVIHMCRDMTVFPDNSSILADSFKNAKIKDVALDNGKRRWLRIFERLHLHTTTKEVGILPQKTISRACSRRSTHRCTSKEIIKLILQGALAVDDKYKCAFESKKPLFPVRPAYRFNKKLPMVDLVDSKIRVTLGRDELGGEIAIVIVLGRIHLIKRESYEHEWYLINKVGVATAKDLNLSEATSNALSNNFLEYEWRVLHKQRVTVPTFSGGSTGSVELDGNLGCEGDSIHDGYTRIV